MSNSKTVVKGAARAARRLAQREADEKAFKARAFVRKMREAKILKAAADHGAKIAHLPNTYDMEKYVQPWMKKQAARLARNVS
jgi:hypothetical protein